MWRMNKLNIIILCYLIIGSCQVYACEQPDESKLEEYSSVFRNIDPEGNIGSNMNGHAIDLYFKDKVKYEDVINELFRIAAHMGDKGGQYNRGRRLVEGDGIKANLKAGRCWLEMAANQNNTQSLYYLGKLDFRENEGIAKERASGYYKKAADLGYSPAMCSLGLSYLKGEGVEKDFERAIHYMEKSVKAGNQICATNLILIYTEGLEVTKDYCEAIKWISYPFDTSSVSEERINLIRENAQLCEK